MDDFTYTLKLDELSQITTQVAGAKFIRAVKAQLTSWWDVLDYNTAHLLLMAYTTLHVNTSGRKSLAHFIGERLSSTLTDTQLQALLELGIAHPETVAADYDIRYMLLPLHMKLGALQADKSLEVAKASVASTDVKPA